MFGYCVVRGDFYDEKNNRNIIGGYALRNTYCM